MAIYREVPFPDDVTYAKLIHFEKHLELEDDDLPFISRFYDLISRRT